jgi:hypothetical protein
MSEPQLSPDRNPTDRAVRIARGLFPHQIDRPVEF